MGEVAGIRRLGSAALDLAFVAAGRFDAFFLAASNETLRLSILERLAPLHGGSIARDGRDPGSAS
jgi:signal transduction histidine kinase